MSNPITLTSILRDRHLNPEPSYEPVQTNNESFNFEDTLDREKRKLKIKEAQGTMHLERFKEVVHALDEYEVEAACKIFAKEHPVQMLAALENYICGMANTYKGIERLMGKMNDD